jgi:chemotaxis methyl-accepting protein methylase
MSTSTTSTTTPNNNNNNNNNSFPQQLRKITKALEEDNDDEYLDYLETFTATYNPLDQKVSQIINKNSQFLIKAKFLELIMSRLLPATFSELFLAVLRILAVIGSYSEVFFVCEVRRRV